MINIKDRKISLVVYFSIHVICFTQSYHLYYHKNPSPVEAGKPIQISLVLFTEQYIESGMLYFRDKGEISYQEVVMNYDNENWIGIIPGHRVSLNDIEYVTILHKQDGGRISLPLVEDPFQNPLNIHVSSKFLLRLSLCLSRKPSIFFNIIYF